MRSTQVNVGHVRLGGGSPAVLQSMTTLPATDIEGTISQLVSLYDAGAAMARLAVQGPDCIRAIAVIKQHLDNRGISLPLIADIHFRPQLALAVAPLVEKIRINPGNFVKSSRPHHETARDTESASSTAFEYHERIRAALKPLVRRCIATGTAIRIGTNMGSLPRHIEATLGRSPEALVQATMAYIKVFEDLDFARLVVSVKASHVAAMVAANQMLHQKMTEAGRIYPIHLGVTEAGSGIDGRSKSALGLIPLLKNGIGDTIRVSLTEDPRQEILFARKLMDYMRGSTLSAPAKNAQELMNTIREKTHNISGSDLMIITLADIISAYNDKLSDSEASELLQQHNAGLADSCLPNILQAAGHISRKTDIISCPQCGRNKFDNSPIIQEIADRAGNIPGLKIAIMGCVVNGPGEAADADYALMGHANGLFWLFRHGQLAKKNLTPAHAVQALLKILNDDGHLKSIQ